MRTSNTSASNKSLNLFLARHGQTDWNLQGLMQGQEDVPLNANGLAQAKALAVTFSRVSLQAVYTSPLSRAAATASAIAASHNLEPVPIPDFAEIDHGLWEGVCATELQERYPREWGLWLQKPTAVRLPGGENLSELKNRVVAAWEILRARCNLGDNVLVVAHAAVNKVLLSYFLTWELERFWEIKQENTAVNLVKIYPDFTQVCLLNDTCHLI